MNQFLAISDTIASGASTSGGADLGERAWKRVYLEVGTMSTAAAISVWHKATASGTYYQLFSPTVNTLTSANYSYTVASQIGTNGGIIEIPNGLRYMQIRASAVVSGGVAHKYICTD